MSNRTDWPELVDELFRTYGGMDGSRLIPADPSGLGLRERLMLELHNAFVAGQENQENDPHSVEVPLTAKMRERLDELVEDGYHGDNIAQAAARLLAKQMEGNQAGNGGGSSRAVGFAMATRKRVPRRRHPIQPGEAPYLPFRTPKGESDGR